MNYKGIFKELKEDKYIDIDEISFYEGHYADLYQNLMTSGNYDIDIYKSQAAWAGNKILELACGTGRVGLPLARFGYEVTGVDISKDMLAIYELNISQEARRVKNKIHIMQGDITNLSLKEKYDLIILPATTICLFEDDFIQKIFKCVEELLSENGRFIFDIIRPDISCFLENSRLPFISKWSKADTYNVVWIQEFYIPDQQEILVNMYGEIIRGTETIRNIGYTRKRIITKEIVEMNIRNSGLKLMQVIEPKGLKEEEKFEFYILRK